MSIVAGVDFGTLSVRVSIFDRERGRLGSGTASYPLKRSKDNPEQATQSHFDQMDALQIAMGKALEASDIQGRQIAALAVDATGSSVIPVDSKLRPLDDYYLWCDHRAWHEAQEITQRAREQSLEAIQWCGNTYSTEWGFSKLLHWLRHTPDKRAAFATALENCDMVNATLCGIDSAADAPRSICAMGHKWMWNPRWNGLPSQSFLSSVDPLLDGVRKKITGKYQTSDQIAGTLSREWAKKLGLRSGIPIPASGIDAHWDAIGAHIGLGDVVNVIGTSTCIIGVSEQETPVPGVCGIVPGSVIPHYVGLEAGMSAVGDLFDSIARRAASDVTTLSRELAAHRAGQTGLLRVPWDNGDRTILVNPRLSGITLGWNLLHTAADELFAAMEGTALQTRIILEHMEKHGTPVRSIVNGGGIPQKNDVLNQVYANALRKTVLVPAGDVTSLGAAVFAFLAAGDFSSVEEAQDALCPPFRSFTPDPEQADVYDQLYPLFRELYFTFGRPSSGPLSNLLPALQQIAAGSTQQENA